VPGLERAIWRCSVLTLVIYSDIAANFQDQSNMKRPALNPTIEHIKSSRAAAGLTQKQAAELVMCTVRAWEQWECGNRRMHPGLYDYFLIKTGQKVLDSVKEQCYKVISNVGKCPQK